MPLDLPEKCIIYLVALNKRFICGFINNWLSNTLAVLFVLGIFNLIYEYMFNITEIGLSGVQSVTIH